MAGTAKAQITHNGKELFEVHVEEEGKVSDSILKLRAAIMNKLNAYMDANSVPIIEDDMLEEIISDDDDAPEVKDQQVKGKGKKRSRG
ncbi:hypothetical protein COCOBI_05-3260 [Coccomyxa sp. Obi]|nr:hypothetical protein COCOBI_05-3260 [Coccomyxa sp. Obi]